MFTNDNS
jgi:coatomer subunit beta'